MHMYVKVYTHESSTLRVHTRVSESLELELLAVRPWLTGLLPQQSRLFTAEPAVSVVL